MIYEKTNDDILDLITNPLSNTVTCTNYNHFYYLAFKLALHLGLRNFKGGKLLNNYILGVFANIVKKANSELSKIRNDDKESSKRKTQFHHFYVSTNKKNEVFQELERQSTILRCEYHKSRISEKINVNLDDLLPSSKHSNLWLAFYFSEVLYLLLNGFFEVRLINQEIIISPSKKFEAGMKQRWLAIYSEVLSSASDTRRLKEFCDYNNFYHLSHNTQKSAEGIITVLLDKIFSIQISYLSDELKNSNYLFTLKEIILFSVIMECTSEKSVPMSHFENRTDIEPKTLYLLSHRLVKNESNQSIISAASFIRFENNLFIRGNKGFRFGLKKLASLIPIDKKKDPLGKMGESFEVDYLYNYLKHLGEYKVFPEFKSGTNAKTMKYDIDFVLHDEPRNLFYFIQVKYWSFNIPIHLDEQIKFFNGKLQDGIKQLQVLKDNIDQEDIRNKLQKHGLEKAQNNNSFFILLHNISFLSFYETSGIIMHEWNSFRNIIQKGKIISSTYKNAVEISSDIKYSPKKVLIHETDKLIEEYFLNRPNDIGEDFSTSWEFSKHAWENIILNGLNFKIKANG